MAIEEILSRIKRDAEKEVARIEEEARKEIQAVEGAGEQRFRDLEEWAREERERSVEEARKRVRIQLEASRNRALLEEKQILIEEAFKKALGEVCRRDKEGYLALIERLLLQASSGGEEEVIIAPEDEKFITEGFLKNVSKKLAAEGRPAQLILSPERRAIKGGFILRKGRKETNATVESLLHAKRDDLEKGVAERLFSQK